MSDFLLTQVINYGAPLLGLIVFLGALGAPFPCTLLVVAAGAFARQEILAWHTAGLIALASVVLGDSVSYFIGHVARGPILTRYEGTARWIQAEASFRRWGGLSILLTRFLITALAVPVNLIASTSRFPFGRFVIYDTLGEALWIFGYGGLGYVFGTQWEAVSQLLSNISGLLLGLLLLAIGIWLAIRWFKIAALRRTNA